MQIPKAQKVHGQVEDKGIITYLQHIGWLLSLHSEWHMPVSLGIKTH